MYVSLGLLYIQCIKSNSLDFTEGQANTKFKAKHFPFQRGHACVSSFTVNQHWYQTCCLHSLSDVAPKWPTKQPWWGHKSHWVWNESLCRGHLLPPLSSHNHSPQNAHTLPPFHPSFRLSLHCCINHQGDHRLVPGEWQKRGCPFHHLFKMQVKLYRVARMSAIWNSFLHKIMTFFLFSTSLKTTLNFTASTSWRQQYDNCQFYLKMLTIGTMVGARKGVEEEMGALDLLDGSHSGDPINITSNANSKSAWGLRHFTSRATAVSSKTSRHSGHCLHCKTQSATRQSRDPPLVNYSPYSKAILVVCNRMTTLICWPCKSYTNPCQQSIN